MDPIYIKQVLQDYLQKKAGNNLPESLASPSPAKVRDACLRVCRERYQPMDARILSDFFGKGTDQESFMKVIGKFKTDKFRPLVNFMKEATGEPDYRVVEMVAWVIDYEDRPYDYRVQKEVKPPAAAQINGELAMGVTVMDEPGVTRLAAIGKDEPYSAKQRPIRRLVLGCILALACMGLGMYWHWNAKPMKMALTGHESCMYWAGDHYEPVSCSHSMGDTLVVALDSDRLLHFKKITNTNSIAQNSKGSVWYIRYNGQYEYYTAGGAHPLDPRLRLRPLTDYIIRNHLQIQQTKQ